MIEPANWETIEEKFFELYPPPHMNRQQLHTFRNGWQACEQHNLNPIASECGHKWMVNWRVDKERDPFMRVCSLCDRKEQRPAGSKEDEWEVIREGL